MTNGGTGQGASTRAIWALVCGILAWTGCPLLGAIAAILLGHGQGEPLGRVGAILGWVQLALIVAIIGVGLVFALVSVGLTELTR